MATVIYEAFDTCGRTLRITRKRISSHDVFMLEIDRGGNVQTIAALSGTEALSLGRALLLSARPESA